jgi:hypothetical protein
MRPGPGPRDENDCTHDEDCVLVVVVPCSCGPCGDVVHPTLNRKTYEERLRYWSIEMCAPRSCDPCQGNYLGTRAVCEKGHCTAR